MKKRIFCLLLCMLLILPTISSAVDIKSKQKNIMQKDSEKISIVDWKHFVLPSNNVFNFRVMYSGDEPLEDVPWSIEYSRFFGSLGLSKTKTEGTLEQINPYESVFIQSDPVFGFSLRTNVTVTVGDVQRSFSKNIRGRYSFNSLFQKYQEPTYFYHGDGDGDHIAVEFMQFYGKDIVEVQVTNNGDSIESDLPYTIMIFDIRYRQGATLLGDILKSQVYEKGEIATLAPGESVCIQSKQLDSAIPLRRCIIYVYIESALVGYTYADFINGGFEQPKFFKMYLPLEILQFNLMMHLGRIVNALKLFEEFLPS